MSTAVTVGLLTFIAGSVAVILLERFVFVPYLDRRHMAWCRRPFCANYHHTGPDGTTTPKPEPDPGHQPACPHAHKIHLRDDAGPDTIECLDCGANLDLKRRTTR